MPRIPELYSDHHSPRRWRRGVAAATFSQPLASHPHHQPAAHGRAGAAQRVALRPLRHRARDRRRRHGHGVSGARSPPRPSGGAQAPEPRAGRGARRGALPRRDQGHRDLPDPNLPPLLDNGAANGHLCYVMPFVEGESLRMRLEREKQLPIEDALRIAVACANALDYAHGHGVIHRDLKPENILLQHGQPVVADFGIALAVSKAGGNRITQTGLSLGTPQYMSPEQATGDRIIDGRSDIYSLAAVTYEMLAGEPPHIGHTAQ